ncbi:MAG: HD domain-containing protein [Actinomycetota bacterium]|nr:HD domain-containing protein [Actinomycetota bacterium]
MSATAVATTLAAGRKAAQLYPQQHPAFVEAIDGLVGAASETTGAGPLQLNLHQGHLYHQSAVLPDDAPGVVAIAEAFEVRKIESMTFHPGFSREEAIGLVEVLGLRPSATLDIEAELSARGVTSVSLAFLAEEDAEEKKERDRIREQDRALYNRLVSVLRTLSTQVAQGGANDLGTAGTVVGNVMRRLLEDQSAVLGLATIRGQTESNLFHSINVMIYSLALGHTLGLPEQGLASLGLSALMHDIGKAAFKADDPTQAEPMARMHPSIGADILSRLPDEDRAPMLVAYEHHMYVDGSGVPERPNDYVPHPYSRMVSIANRYANLTNPGSPDIPALTPDKAIVTLLREARTRFDPMFVRLFAKAMGVFPIGCIVRLSDQSVGVVCRAGTKELAPVVRVVYDAGGLGLDEPIELDLDGSELAIVEVVGAESLNVEVSDHL